MNSKFLETIRQKGAEKKAALNHKKEFESEKATTQDEIKRMMAEGKQNSKEFQELVNKDKSLDNKVFAKNAEAGQKQSEIEGIQQKLSKERADNVGKGLKKSANEPLEADDNPNHPQYANPIPLRKGNPIHQFTTPYEDSSSTISQEENIPDYKKVKDWNAQKDNSHVAVNETQAATKEQAQQIGKDMQDKLQQQKGGNAPKLKQTQQRAEAKATNIQTYPADKVIENKQANDRMVGGMHNDMER